MLKLPKVRTFGTFEFHVESRAPRERSAGDPNEDNDAFGARVTISSILYLSPTRILEYELLEQGLSARVLE